MRHRDHPWIMMSDANNNKSCMTALLSLLLLVCCCGVDGFSQPHFHSPSTSTAAVHSTTIDRFIRPTLSSKAAHYHRCHLSSTLCRRASTSMNLAALSIDATSAPHLFASLAVTATSVDPLIEAEVLNDMAHVALDFFTVIGPPRVLTRLAAIVGRVLVMLADYVPDHKILPEELVFQACMMGAACFGLIQATLLPMAMAAITEQRPPSLRDGKAFAALFEPFGTTWSQFKAMRAICLDWIEVKPHQVIWNSKEQYPSLDSGIEKDNDDDDDDDFIYWLYRGQAVILTGDGSKVLNHVLVPDSKQSYKEAVSKRLLGETHLITNLVVTTTAGIINKKINKAKRHQDLRSHLYPATMAKAGKEGATLLRINVRSLKFMLEADPTLAESMRTLVFSSLQDKLMAAVQQELLVEEVSTIASSS